MADYSANRKKQWRIIIKRRVVESLGGQCCNCGAVFNNVAMYDVHHINFEKDFSISNIQTNGARAWLKIRDELRKCCLLCPNCHRGYHCGEIEISFKDNYFNEDYYEWEATTFQQLQIASDLSLVPLDRDKKKYVCSFCGKPKSYSGEVCRNCISKKQWKCKHPSKEEMVELIKNHSLLQIAKMYGVSDNSIRKWLQNYNLPYKLEDIKKFFGKEYKEDENCLYYNFPRSVSQYTLKGEYIQTFESLTSAIKIVNKNAGISHISDVCNGKRKSAYGYLWKWEK